MAFGANKGTWLFGANSITANNNATLSTGSAVVAKGDLIVVVIGEVVANTSSGATDTLGNTYTAITAGTLVGATVSGCAFYTIVTNPGTNTNITVQATASANNVAIVAASYEGQFSAIDKQPANNNNTDNASPFTCPATGTLAQQLELIVAWMVDNTANVKTATSPNIKANQQSQVTVSSVLGSQVVNVTTTVSPAFTGTNPTASIQGTASFRAAGLPENVLDLSLPNRGAPYSLSYNWTESLLPLPLAGAVQAPFNQEDWQVPAGYYYPNQLRVWSVRGPAYVEPPPAPVVDIDTVRAPHFSPPRQPLTLLYDVPRNLTTLLASKIPFNQYNWPLAIGPEKYHVSLRSWAGVQFKQAVIAGPIGQILLAPVRGYEHHFQLRVWSVSGPKFIIAAARTGPFNQYDWPLARGYEFSVNLRSWTFSPKPVAVAVVVETAVFREPHFERQRASAPLLSTQPLRPLTLFAAPVQIPFSQSDWQIAGAPRQPQRSWTASYNLNLIGKDIVPGKLITERPAIAPRLLQTWINAVNLVLTAAPAAPFSQSDWQLPVTWRQPQRSWTASYNLNLIGQDKFPTGKIITDRPTLAAIRVTDLSTWIDQTKLLLAVPFGQSDWPLPRAHLLPQRSWTWSYNLNLIGKDALPTGEIISGLPPQPPLTAIQLRTWINSAALALITVPPAKPFAQYDWPLNFGPLQPVTIFTATYNKNLIGKDIVPGRIVYELPPRAPQQPAQSFTGKYNENLIGKDRLPTGAEITDLPPRQALRPENLRTWIQSVNLALTTQAAVLPNNQSDWPIRLPPTPQARTFIGFYNLNLIGKDRLPINQSDWPLPRTPLLPQRSWTASYNLNLIGKDQLPVGEINTSLPAQQRLALQTWINAVNLALTSVTALPFNQSSWPINTGPRQPDRSYGHVFSRVLIGQDRLPFRQQDWPIWRDYQRAPPSFTAFYNRNLIGKDRLPFRQQDWPLPRDPRRLAVWINLTDPNLFIPGPAPPPPRSPSHRDVSLFVDAARPGEAEQIRPEAPQSRRPAAPQSTRSNVQDPGIRR